ncbi:MAG TPA: hypothetical protein VFV65_05440 [Gemmatimonadales bacterium]|nr:hypothetical protein [Gemmatimonadales bacterium]
MSPALAPRGITRRKLAVALAVAAVADACSIFLTLAPPLGWAVDFATAALLFAILGWRWMLLPGLVMEAIPGLAVFPFWVLVVLAVAVGGRSGPQALKGE